MAAEIRLGTVLSLSIILYGLSVQYLGQSAEYICINIFVVN